MKKILINLKDWLNLEENIEFIENIQNSDLTIFPSLPYLYLYKDKNFNLGIQDIPENNSGPHTGSTSIDHLKDFNISTAIVNHRENKTPNYNILKNKIEIAMNNQLKIIMCIDKVDNDIITNIKNIHNELLNPMLSIAYEPDEVLNIDEIKHNIHYLKDQLKSLNITYIYGGNISEENIDYYNKELDVDGFLISSHALNPESLKKICEICKS